MTSQYYQRIITIFLLIFCAMRPIISTAIFNSPSPLGLSIAEIFAIAFSYGLILAVLLNGLSRKIGLVELSILAFIFYAFLSLIWGSNLKEITRLTLPFAMFFAVRLAVVEIETLKRFIKTMFIVFLIPTLGSALLILTGLSESLTSYWTGLTRYSGVYAGSHSLAHEMFIFLAIVILYVYINQLSNDEKRLPKFLIYLAICFSILNIYMSLTRTVYIGLVIFIFFHLFGRKQYLLLLSGIFLILIFSIVSDKASLIFFDILGPITGDDIMGAGYRGMGSGRVGLWQDALAKFSALPFERYFLGIGIGREAIYSVEYFGASHSDIIGVLLGLGIIGIVLYFAVICSFLIDILNSNFDKTLKYTFSGFIFAVLAMNLGSNSYLSRFQLSQYFFYIIGLFYVFLYLYEDLIRQAEA